MRTITVTVTDDSGVILDTIELEADESNSLFVEVGPDGFAPNVTLGEHMAIGY